MNARLPSLKKIIKSKKERFPDYGTRYACGNNNLDYLS